MIPVDLFLVSKVMHVEIKEIFFSSNRFILNSDFKATRCWLFDLCPTAARLLRMIDLKISWEQLYIMAQPHSTIGQDWVDRIACAASVLPVENVWLSTDACDLW